MIIQKKVQKKITRNEKFIFSEPSETQARFDISDIRDTEELGKKLAEIYKEIPIKAIYITGYRNSGKTVLSTNIIWNLGQSRKTFPYKKGAHYREIGDNPKIYLVDYGYKNNQSNLNIADSQLKNKIELNENELLIAEYYEKMPDYWIEPNRIEIELVTLGQEQDISTETEYIPSIKNKNRYATIIGHGEGEEFVKRLNTAGV